MPFQMTPWQFEWPETLKYTTSSLITAFGSDLYFTYLFIFPFHYRAKSTDSEMSEDGLTSNSINFIKEDQTSLLGPGHLEELTHHPGPLHTNGTFSIISGFTTIQYFLF